TEGMVADDELGWLYVGEEAVGIWRYGAEPGDGTSRTSVDTTGGGNLTADVEGLTLYYASDSTGYLIASSQGSDDFAIYKREGNNDYVKNFDIVSGGGIDGVSGTDGIDVSNAALGSTFPSGVFIAQDNSNSGGNQNYKLVAWEDIAAAGSPQLTVDTAWSPRGPSADVTSRAGVFRRGRWYLDLNGNELWDGGDTSFSFGLRTDTPLAGDWDGNGTDETGVYRRGVWYLDANGNDQWDGGDVTVAFGLRDDLPVPGDWDGDGTDQVGVYRSGVWYLDLNGNALWDGGDTLFAFGLRDDLPVAGDWDGDGTDEIGVFRGGTWYLDLNGNNAWDGGDVTFRFGASADLPVVGDWDGDGTDEVGTYRNGTWYLDLNGNNAWDGGDTSYRFGASADTPVPGCWSN
ncbi:MAG: phytase, partial [Planctomycetota bacterium]